MPYIYHYGSSPVAASRKDWLEAILTGRHRPKPPEWWLKAQELEEGRNRGTASIIWSRYYNPSRKYVIWEMADEADFETLGYLR